MRGLAAKGLLPGERSDIELSPIEFLGEGGGGRVADRQTLAAGRDPIGIGDAHAGRRSVPGEDDVIVEIRAREIGDLAVVSHECAGVVEFQMLDDIVDPAFAEGVPGEDIDATLAEQGPKRDFDRAGIRARDDSNSIILRNPQNLAGQIDHAL